MMADAHGKLTGRPGICFVTRGSGATNASAGMHQERHYPGRISGTTLGETDFAALAIAYGGHGEVVSRTDDFAAAFERAQNADKPALIELRLEPEAITPTATLSELRKTALSTYKSNDMLYAQ